MDYTDVTSTLTFDATVSTQVAVVPILDDNVVEDSEFINVTLMSADHVAVLNPSTARITIEDIDSELTTFAVVLSLPLVYSYSCSLPPNATMITGNCKTRIISLMEDSTYVCITFSALWSHGSWNVFHDFSCAGWI